MAAREVALSEDKWIESLLADAEKRLSVKDSKQVAVVAPKQASLAKASKALAPQPKLATEAPKKQDDLTIRIPQSAAQKAKVRTSQCMRMRIAHLSIPSPPDENLSHFFMTQRDIPLWETLLHHP
jgi:hypothetical protein